MPDDANPDEAPASNTLRGILAAAPAPESLPPPAPSPLPEAETSDDEFKITFNQRLVRHGFKLIASGHRQARLQRDDVDCVWQLKPGGLAYQLRYLDPKAAGVDSSKPGVLRGAPVSEPFRPMTELAEIARQLAAAVAEEAEMLPARMEASRRHAEALARWNSEKSAADARDAAARRAEIDAQLEADRKIANEVARQAREQALMKQNERDAAELTALLPKGWAAFPTELASQGNVVLQSRSIPPALTRELAAALPVVNRTSGYAELRTFLDQVHRWRARDEQDRHAALAGVFVDVERDMEERRRRESSLLGRAMKALGLESRADSRRRRWKEGARTEYHFKS